MIDETLANLCRQLIDCAGRRLFRNRFDCQTLSDTSYRSLEHVLQKYPARSL